MKKILSAAVGLLLVGSITACNCKHKGEMPDGKNYIK